MVWICETRYDVVDAELLELMFRAGCREVHYGLETADEQLFLDVAKPDDLILITSFGSGAGSDSFILKATKRLPEVQDLAPTVRSMLDGPRHYVTYGEYAKFREKIIVNE